MPHLKPQTPPDGGFRCGPSFPYGVFNILYGLTMINIDLVVYNEVKTRIGRFFGVGAAICDFELVVWGGCLGWALCVEP